MASSRNVRIDFYGKSAHSALPHAGVDVLACAVRTYNSIQHMHSREIDPFAKHVCSIGKLDGGTSQNIIADHTYMLGTIRTFDMKSDESIIKRITDISEDVAKEVGAEVTVDSGLKAFVVYNDRLVTRNADKRCTTLPHNNDFMIDEDALPVGTDTCVQFVLDNMNRIGVTNDKN